MSRESGASRRGLPKRQGLVDGGWKGKQHNLSELIMVALRAPNWSLD